MAYKAIVCHSLCLVKKPDVKNHKFKELSIMRYLLSKRKDGKRNKLVNTHLCIKKHGKDELVTNEISSFVRSCGNRYKGMWE